MRVKPKEVLLNLPIVLMFSDAYKIAEFAANINQLIYGKSKVKYEELGILGDQYVGLFYLQRNDEFTALRQQFIEMIDQERIREHDKQMATERMNIPCPQCGRKPVACSCGEARSHCPRCGRWWVWCKCEV